MQFFDSPEQAIAALIVLAVLLLVAFPIHEFSPRPRGLPARRQHRARCSGA